MIEPTVKRAGCCTWCDEEVYEIITRFPEGPLSGYPRKIGKPLDSARRISYALVDGSRADLTCCAGCEFEMTQPVNMPIIWQKVIRSFMFEEQPDVRAALPAAPRTPAQTEIVLREIERQITNYPIAVICTTSLTEGNNNA